ncbi:hypothetical protein [Pedobacter namyangjuensis]|uniref:hypothetical protein n=1 Tax=Pedobacter namyangjuensis TaxID=600626 RepID=UPI000DE36555|nr:hypothetical protein [Pedobacter namyangjuensis]
MAFEKDTIYPDLFLSTLNVDGDIRRVLRFYSEKDTIIFPLSNAVNNYTIVSCYSLNIRTKRYLWLEDNFGTFVLDINLKKVVNVKLSKIKLSEIAPTGASMGTKMKVTNAYIKNQLRLNRVSKIIILDSLHFKM